jgi:hypothetical protein
VWLLEAYQDDKGDKMKWQVYNTTPCPMAQIVQGTTSIAYLAANGYVADHAEAISSLIAAAPDMLAALEAVERSAIWNDTKDAPEFAIDRDIARMIRNAIRAAKGE